MGLAMILLIIVHHKSIELEDGATQNFSIDSLNFQNVGSVTEKSRSLAIYIHKFARARSGGIKCSWTDVSNLHNLISNYVQILDMELKDVERLVWMFTPECGKSPS